MAITPAIITAAMPAATTTEATLRVALERLPRVALKDETVVFIHTGGLPALFAYNGELATLG